MARFLFSQLKKKKNPLAGESFSGSLFSASLGRRMKDLGCGLSRDHWIIHLKWVLEQVFQRPMEAEKREPRSEIT